MLRSNSNRSNHAGRHLRLLVTIAAALMLALTVTACSGNSSASNGVVVDLEDATSLSHGDIVRFGSFGDDAEDERTDLEWYVLDANAEAGYALLMTRDVILTSSYAISSDSLSETEFVYEWDSCFLNEILNAWFYNDAFSEEEQSRIGRYVAGGREMEPVFILSHDEAGEYLPVGETAQWTPYAVSILDGIISSDTTNGEITGAIVERIGRAWVLRDSGLDAGSVGVILEDGSFCDSISIQKADGTEGTMGLPAGLPFGVRPVICVSYPN